MRFLVILTALVIGLDVSVESAQAGCHSVTQQVQVVQQVTYVPQVVQSVQYVPQVMQQVQLVPQVQTYAVMPQVFVQQRSFAQASYGQSFQQRSFSGYGGGGFAQRGQFRGNAVGGGGLGSIFSRGNILSAAGAAGGAALFPGAAPLGAAAGSLLGNIVAGDR